MRVAIGYTEVPTVSVAGLAIHMAAHSGYVYVWSDGWSPVIVNGRILATPRTGGRPLSERRAAAQAVLAACRKALDDARWFDAELQKLIAHVTDRNT